MGSGAADFLAGALAGAAADVTLYPMDTIRARLMVSPAARGVLREGLQLVRSEGTPALYKGLGAHLLASLPGNGMFYFAYEAARAAAAAHMGASAAASVAAVAGCLASLLIYTPMEVVKQRAMVTRGADSASILRSLLRDEGAAGLYRGLGAAALTWAPYFSLYFYAYEALTGRLFGVPAGEQPPFATALGCGLVAGIGASSLTNPFDVVKTRMQVGAIGLGAKTAAAGIGDSAWAVARHISATEGAAGFTRGLLPRVLLLAPLSSLTIAFYSVARRATEVMRGGKPRAAETEGA